MGRGEKEKRGGKERREEEKRGRKRDLKTPLGLRGYYKSVRRARMRDQARPAIWRRLSEAKPRRSRGAASLRAAVTNRLFRPRPKMKERTVLSLLSKFEASSSLPHRDIRV